MKPSPAARVLALCLMASISLQGFAQVAAGAAKAGSETAPPAAANGEDMEPKFIWGLLLNIAFKLAMNAFANWAVKKLTSELASPANMQKLVANTATAAIVPLARMALGIKSAGALENVSTKEATMPLKLENGQPNYQGVHVALIGFDPQGNPTGLRPVSDGFKSGDRIKLKVLPTFDGMLVIENINPKGERKQIYPPQNSDVVALKGGIEVLVPLGRDQYFEFAGATGDEQLVVTIRDPRAVGSAESPATPSRKDDDTGSSFVQETPNNTFPVISQAIKLQHGAKQ